MFRRLHASSFAPLASFVAVLAVSLLALGLGRPALAGSWENLDEVIQKRGAIAIGIGYSTPPMNYLDDQGQHAGFDVDLAKALAERMHLRYTVVKVNNKTRITSLSGGETDMVLSNMNRTMSRARQIDFSYHCLAIDKRYAGGLPQMTTSLERQFADFAARNRDMFAAYGCVKVY